jgi:hypothetical protein
MTAPYSQGSHRHAAVSAVRRSVAGLLLIMAAGLAGCATNPLLHAAKPVLVCAAEECSEAGQRYSANQLLYALDRLFQANDGAGMKFCNSDPVSRICTDNDVGYFILGGIIPGRGSSSSGKVSQVKLDAENQSIRYVMAMNLWFLGIPLVCADHDAVLAVNSVYDVTITDNSYLCNWMVTGIMTASFSFVIDSIDFDQGRLGGYWKHGVTGTGNGRGQGYALIEFPKSMPRGENWLAQK